MTDLEQGGQVSRRQALKLGGMAGATSLALGGTLLGGAGGAAAAPLAGAQAAASTPGHLPVKEIESIIRAQGTVSNGVLNIEIDRDDIPHVHKEGVPIKPAFQINGNLCFQAMSNGSVMFNGDLAFKAGELNPAIDQMLKHGMAWQAMHQHLWGLHPMVWFMHMRMRGPARKVAEACRAVLSVTSTPLPQAPPKHPTTPLDPHRLAKIIGQPATVGASGVVGISVPRRNPIILAGVHISPFLNVYIPVDFQPLGGDKAVVVPDMGMTAEEIPKAVGVMRAQGWEQNCLYNQETDEHPQLYFDHMFKVGNAYELAKEVRRGLEQLDVVIH
jgi:Domain of Unknown Function (DUF1259)